jgi:iron complex outermembrane receptor protein
MNRYPAFRNRCVLGLLLLALPPAARGQEPRPAEVAALAGAADPSALKRLSLEELMQIDVTSVSKRNERLSAAAAAITVITAEDIRRSGATSLAETLRLATGLEVAQADGRTWAITARGFNLTTANKLLVLIDGRSIYTPLFSGVFWDVQDTLLPDVERIEIIRGPGATLWGANAVNGVINIITKSSRETQGGVAVAGGGEKERAFGGVRYGGQAGSGVSYRAYGNYDYRDALTEADGRSAQDPLRRGQGGFRLDWDRPKSGATKADTVTLQGDLYQGLAGEAIRPDTELSGGNLLGRFTRPLEGGGDLRLQLYFDHTHRRTPEFFEERRNTYDLDLQHHFLPTARQEVVWGIGYRVTADQVGNSAVVAFLPDHRTQSLLNLFAQDEITLLPDRVHLTVGSKLEHNDYTGFELQPSLRLSYTPSPEQTLWGAISRAVRTPTRIDTDVRFDAGSLVLLRGDTGFRSETVVAYELGWRLAPRQDLTFDVATYYNVYSHLRSQELTGGDNLPIFFANKLKADTWGGEAAANYQLLPWWRWYAGYSYLHKRFSFEPGSTDGTEGLAEGNDPTGQLWLRTSLDLPGRTELDGWLRHVDALPSPKVPAYTELDLRLGWRATPALEISLAGRNLLHAHHPEFGSPGPTREEVPRSLYGKVEWHF